ncbi:aldo/keto reductase [Alteromonas mediterranea]|uniref:Aldo/keto reductase n=2 Tax=Alteromonas mediterranea TaxID=314275 RepID=S5AEK3_9ALTE|nr:aldo/keto reductase [Alteromonas mediterranea]AGP78315.1 aldo/keto reductase precursor [Alteromonas mediterranea 615]AFV85841.1 aldo/keto reductase precursor [Alteromonas mediterranea DE1]AGP97853.1 aldo/keto reductase precursor [Alteromonas mediterranea UM7]AGQ02104.1 aldo/keto reductase precursor [Alteromonas mediterranea UM4b]AMJ78875.1 aldo/keto reductase [Alteromonas mediterranea]|tara:strand:- start:6709 stop:7836 length:1128 start_codon:yes stop_codon:yes gene_type:complete
MQNRREFLLSGASLAAASLLSTNIQASTSEQKKRTTSTSPNTRKLGKLQVSSIGLGVQNMSRKYDTSVPNRQEMHQVIRSAYEEGVTFFDAAEAYGPFEVERILGESVKPFRDNIVIATKFGWNIDQQTGARLPGLNSRPDHIKAVVEGMLSRLQTDRIDLLYQHRVDPAVPIEEVAGAVADLMKEGKVLHWGLSEMGINTLKRAHATLPVSAVQSEYSMLWRGPEKSVLPLCEKLGIGFVPWSPLGVQFLTGWIDENTRFAQGDFRATESRFNPENLAHNMSLVKLLMQWSERKNATPAQIALAWLLHQKPWIVPIPGTTSLVHMQQNTASRDLSFSTAELRELNDSLASITIQGQRLPDFVQVFSDVEAPEKL